MAEWIVFRPNSLSLQFPGGELVSAALRLLKVLRGAEQLAHGGCAFTQTPSVSRVLMSLQSDRGTRGCCCLSQIEMLHAGFWN